MTRRAELEVALSNRDALFRDLGAIEDRIKELSKESGRVSLGWMGKQAQAAAKEWEKPTSAITEFTKTAAGVIFGQVYKQQSAIVAAGRTTYEQALAEGRRYRRSTQAVRQVTGNWKGAAEGLDAFSNRARQTGKTLGEMAGPAAMLMNNFGIKGTEAVNRFFGTVDSQARKAGISIGQMDTLIGAMGERMAGVGFQSPATATALLASVASSTRTASGGINMPRATAATDYLMDTLNRGYEQIVKRMRKSGYGKVFDLFDWKTGQLNDKNILLAKDFIAGEHGDVARHHGGFKNAVRIEAGHNLFDMPTMYAALKSRRASDLANVAPTTSTAEADYLATSAGRGDQLELQKRIRDIGLGLDMLPAQDRAIAAGGGQRGVFMEDTNALALGGGLWLDAKHDANRLERAERARRALENRRLGRGSFWERGMWVSDDRLRQQAAEGAPNQSVAPSLTEYHLDDRATGGLGTYVPPQQPVSDTTTKGPRMGASVVDTGLGAQVQEHPVGGAQEITIPQGDQRTLADAIAGALASRTLTVREAPPIEAPQGQPSR